MPSLTNNTDDAPPRFPDPTGFAELLGPAVEQTAGMQDWPREVADETRLAEFCALYAVDTLPRLMQFTLMQLIVCSLDDALSGADPDDGELQRIAGAIDTWLRRDFLLHLHTVNYGRLADEPQAMQPDEELFPMTPMMRRIWADCYKTEYVRYKPDYETWQ